MLARDALGRIVPDGRLLAQNDWWANGSGGALPPWLTTNAGTLSFGDPSVSGGEYGARWTTAATSGSKAQVRSYGLVATNFSTLYWQLRGLRFDTAAMTLDATVRIGNSVGRGVAFQHLAADGDGTFGKAIVYPSTLTSTRMFQLGTGVGDKRRDLSLLWQRRENRLYVLLDDQPMAVADTTGHVSTGTIYCDVEITTQSAAARSFDLLGTRLGLYR